MTQTVFFPKLALAMFAIVETSGTQYKVSKGQVLEVDRIDQKEGAIVTFDKVLLLHDKDTKIGTPIVPGASVSAKIVSHQRGEKIVVFKMKAKKRYRRTRGHRSDLTTIEITDIKIGSAKSAEKEKAVEPKKKVTKSTTKKTTSSTK